MTDFTRNSIRPLIAEEVGAFRQEVRAWIGAALPASIRDKVARGGYLDSGPLTREDYVAWQGLLDGRGWGAPNWPAEYGGPGWTPLQRYVFEDEAAAADCPQQLPHGLNMVAPVIYTFGNLEQKRKYLPRIRSGEDWWCQGFSEPDAGSDLASLKTSARKEGARYVINGQKTWTSFAQHANMMFCLARTDPTARPQAGISFLLLDMSSAGIEVRPIRTIDGGNSVNEVFLTDVSVPAENLVGEEGKGWSYAKFLLGHERSTISGVSRSRRRLAQLCELFGTLTRGLPEGIHHAFRLRMASLQVDLVALEEIQLRVILNEEGQGHAADASVLKVLGTELHQRLNDLFIEMMGEAALPYSKGFPTKPPAGLDWFATGEQVAWHLYGQALSIYGGSNEIQRSIIARQLLHS